MKYFLKNILILLLLCINNSYLYGNIDNNIIENAKHASVSIDTSVSVSPWGNNGKHSGTGFITNINDGLIITNFHVTSMEGIGEYTITFFNGKRTDAKLIFYSLWQDVAILQVNPDSIPKTAKEITFTNKEVKVGEQVFIVGNNEAFGFSIHEGHLSDKYFISGIMPQQSYVINLNSTGGSSGSPVIDTKGKAIGLHYGGGKTSGLCTKGKYIENILASISKSQLPSQKHIGIIIKTIHMDDAIKHNNLPKTILKDYLKNWPDSRGRILTVDHVISGSQAIDKILPGDIIWKANKKEVGPSLYELDNIMNNTNKDLELEIYRNGKKITLFIPTYDVEENKVYTILDFNGALLFKSNDITSRITGIPIKEIAVMNIKRESPFFDIRQKKLANDTYQFRLSPLKINNHQITSIEKLVNDAKNIVAEKKSNILYKNYQRYHSNFGYVQITGYGEKQYQNITFNPESNYIKLHQYNKDLHMWEMKKII